MGSWASPSLRGNQSPRGRPPTDPSHPGAGWHHRQWTWGCFRSWGWERVEVSAAASVSASRLPSPVATALPSFPSRWRHGCWTWEREKGASEIRTLPEITRRKPSLSHPYRNGPPIFGSSHGQLPHYPLLSSPSVILGYHLGHSSHKAQGTCLCQACWPLDDARPRILLHATDHTLTLAAAAVAESWKKAGAGPGQTVGWCWPGAGGTVVW